MATDITQIWEELVWEKESKIVYLVLDGLGGIPKKQSGETSLQGANTPNLDQLAQNSSCGLLEIVGAGITPGSGPGHLSLFGYDPIKYRIGRGILSALGVDFELQEGDVAARVNFASITPAGDVSDRRAGRISTELNEKLCAKIRENVKLDFDGQYFLETVSEHRAVLVLRGEGLGGQLEDTDPQQTKVKPLPPTAKDQDSEKTVSLVKSFVQQVQQVLADENPANMILLRGFDQYKPFPSLRDRFKIRGLCVADYPMYRGVSRLLGMDVVPKPGGIEARFKTLVSSYKEDYNFFFLHVKKPDSKGEDANFVGKVKVIEQVDQLLPHITQLNPDVLVVTADHSTPAQMGQHSWHPVPLMIYAPTARVDAVAQFDEYSCSQGVLGLRPGIHVMGLAMAHAGMMKKFGA